MKSLRHTDFSTASINVISTIKPGLAKKLASRASLLQDESKYSSMAKLLTIDSATPDTATKSFYAPGSN